MSTSEAITQGIQIRVQSEYLEQESSPDNKQYVFAYHVTLINQSDETVQLISRHWIINNADGKKEEVKGMGVIGQQPVIPPGETFTYSSFCPLETPVGSMYGTYQMLNEDGEEFDAKIAPFTLAVPGILQ